MFFELMGKHTFKRVHIISSSTFLDNLSDLVVEMSRLDQSEGSLCSFVGSKDDVCFFACDGCIFVRLHYHSVGSEGSKSIDVCS